MTVSGTNLGVRFPCQALRRDQELCNYYGTVVRISKALALVESVLSPSNQGPAFFRKRQRAEECCFAMKKTLSAIQGGGDYANVIFGGASVRMFRIGHTTMTDTKLQEILLR